MLVNNRDMLLLARKRDMQYLHSIRSGNYDIIWSICKTAEEMQSPVILAHYISTGAYSGHDWFVQVAKWCANKVSVPV